MATGEVEVMDDDRWLYGDGIDTGTSEPSDMAAMDALLNEGVREGTPDLDEIEATSGLNQLPVANPTPTLQLKTLQQDPETEIQDNESTEVKENGDDVTTSGKEEGLGGTEDDLSNEEDDDDDGVNITIGTIQNPALFNRAHAQFGIPPILGAAVGTEVAPPKKVDLETIPQINGVPLTEVDIDESIVDKPWRKPGADITDYFNYGFTEETWRLYCEKQRKMRHEVNQMNKLVVTSTMTPTTKIELNKPPMFGFPPPSMDLAMLNPNVILPPIVPTTSINNVNQEEVESDGNEEKGTPPPDPGVLPPKLPILPPPGLPPTIPFPPTDVNAAAAMAAMFTGGPPPPIRPPDFPPTFPPPMHGGIPHFPPPIPGDIRPPFLPPGFNISGEPPRGLDDPRAAGLFNAELGFPPHWGDPSLGGHPDMVEFSQPNDYGGRGSRSPSRSSSGSSRGSSVERSNHSRRDNRRDKYDSRSSRRTRRSRSRERSSHHRSSRRDHREHRDRDRDRDRERDRDRRSDRHDKERRERRRRDERRHERSSKRHRSRTPDEDDDREKKRSRSRSAS